MNPDELLIARARLLAQVPAQLAVVSRARALVAAIGPQQYGFPIEQVIRVRPLGPCTPVPNAPPGVVGVAKLEGKILAVFGGRSWRGLPEQVRADTPVVVLGTPESPLALLVDSAVETIDIPDELPDLRGAGEPWLRAIVHAVLLVDVSRLIELVSARGAR